MITPTDTSAVRLLSPGRPPSVTSQPPRVSQHWQPPEGLAVADVNAIIDAAGNERDRLLLRTLWATGARISEVLALRALDIHQESLVLPNRKNPGRPLKRVFLPAGAADLPGALLLFQRAQGLGVAEPLFVSRKRHPTGQPRALSRVQAWRIVRTASERAQVQVLALRPSRYGAAGEPAPVHPHLFRHARARQIIRQTRSLPLAQKQLGWSRLHLTYLTLADEEARHLMQAVSD
jgi:integrase/recombinase XerD